MAKPPFEFVVLESCRSTQEAAREKLATSGQSHWVFTDNMQVGRGRAGKKWECLKGNFFLSSARIVDSFPKTLHWPFISHLGALALVSSLQETQLWKGSMFIKWPNDIWVLDSGEGTKLGGMLAERTGSDLILGLGLNTSKAPKLRDSDYQAATLNAPESNLRLAKSFALHFEDLFCQWTHAPEKLQRACVEKLWGQYMEPLKRATIYKDGDRTSLKAVGLSQEGAIELLNESTGERQTCHSGEVQLRF